MWLARTLFLTVLFIVPPAFTQEPAGGAAMTVITSDKLTFDNKGHYVILEGHVVVKDPSLNLQCDYMEVFLTQDNQAKRIVAKGRVEIQQRDVRAKAGQAVYEVGTGVIDLSIGPRLLRQNEMMEADQILYNRFDGRLKGEGNVKIYGLKPKDAPSSANPF